MQVPSAWVSRESLKIEVVGSNLGIDNRARVTYTLLSMQSLLYPAKE
jgi:hypothetical protein